MRHVYEVRNVTDRYQHDPLGFTTSETQAVEFAEQHLSEWPHERVEVLRHRPVEDWEHLNDDVPDRVWDSERGWTGA